MTYIGTYLLLFEVVSWLISLLPLPVSTELLIHCLRRGGNVLPGVCLSVSRITKKLFTNFEEIFGGVRFVTIKTWLDFGVDPAQVTSGLC